MISHREALLQTHKLATRYSARRNEILIFLYIKECVYWLDIGDTADGGQFVLGQPKNDRNRKTPRRLSTVADLYPEIVPPLIDSSDDLPACSAVEALERQEPFINQALAFQVGRYFPHYLSH